MAEYFAQDPIATFSGLEAFRGQQRTLRRRDELLKFRDAWVEPYDDFDLRAGRGSSTRETTGWSSPLYQRGKPHGATRGSRLDDGLRVYTIRRRKI